MPVTTEFEAEGVDNGFPFCTERIDVSDYFMVSPMTLNQVMSIYWNTAKLFATASVNVPSNVPPISISSSDPELDKSPRDRVCSGQADTIGETDSVFGYYACSVTVNTIFSVVKMYNGAIDNEANFIGYGVDANLGSDSGLFARAFAGEDGGFGYLGELIVLTSFARYSPAVDFSDPNYSDMQSWWMNFSVLGNTFVSASSITLNGVPFTALQWNYGNSSYQVGITGIDFYTY